MNALNILTAPQGSPAWLNGRAGVVTASEVKKAIAGKGTETRAGYLAEKVAQICTLEQPEIDGKALQWGRDHEEDARVAYEFLSGNSVSTVGFIYGYEKRTGCSPDGIVEKLNKGVEIKCPFNSRYHVEFLCADKIKKEYMDQIQFSMWVSGFDEWDFVSYDPRFKDGNSISVKTIKRDPKAMLVFDAAIPEFISEMDEMLIKVGKSWGDQWA